ALLVAIEADMIRQLVDSGQVQVTVTVAVVEHGARARYLRRQVAPAAEDAGSIVAVDGKAAAREVRRHHVEIAVTIRVAELDGQREGTYRIRDGVRKDSRRHSQENAGRRGAGIGRHG